MEPLKISVNINAKPATKQVNNLKRKAFWLRLKLKLKAIISIIRGSKNIYELSDDYEILWELVNGNQRVPCLIPMTNMPKMNIPISNVAQFYRVGSFYELNSKGCGYSFGIETKDEFMQFCKENRIEFFNPLI